MLEISKKKMVKTRKEHECYGCCELIVKGETAVRLNGKEDNEHFNIYLHANCHIISVKQKLYAEDFSKGAVKQKLIEGNGRGYGAVQPFR